MTQRKFLSISKAKAFPSLRDGEGCWRNQERLRRNKTDVKCCFCSQLGSVPLVFGLEQGGMSTQGSRNRAERKEWKDKTERGIKEVLLFLHY